MCMDYLARGGGEFARAAECIGAPVPDQLPHPLRAWVAGTVPTTQRDPKLPGSGSGGGGGVG